MLTTCCWPDSVRSAAPCNLDDCEQTTARVAAARTVLVSGALGVAAVLAIVDVGAGGA